MKRPFTHCQNQGRALQRAAVTLLLVTPLTFTVHLPAQAGFIETIRGIFTGDTGEGAEGNARGASIRDRRCGAEAAANPEPTAETGAIAVSESPANADESLILFVPNTGQTLNTTVVAPAVFVYIPATTPAAEKPPISTPEASPPQNQLKFDIDDIDSVVDEAVQDRLEQTPQDELLLEFQFNGTTTYYSLPDEALIAKLQAPQNTAFEIGETSPLEVRFVCRRVDLSALSNAAEIESSYTTEQEVFVEVQRVAESDLLAADDTESDYQVYLENGLWFEMVAAIAENPDSAEWAALLTELDIPTVDPVPQILTPLSD